MVTIRYVYGRNFECFYQDYDTATDTIRHGQFPTHRKRTQLNLKTYTDVIPCILLLVLI